jgi:hypothetical protein
MTQQKYNTTKKQTLAPKPLQLPARHSARELGGDDKCRWHADSGAV